MCDGCGCDKPKNGAPDDEARRARQKDGGWHIHADGTAHCHDHHDIPSPHLFDDTVFRAAAKPVLPQPGPELQDGKDGGTEAGAYEGFTKSSKRQDAFRNGTSEPTVMPEESTGLKSWHESPLG